MEIRTAEPADAWAIAETHVATWRAAYRGHIPDDYLDGLSVADRAGGWRQVLAGNDLPARGVYLAWDGGHVAGFVQFCPSRDDGAAPTDGEVGALYVLPAHWGHGVGRSLLEMALVSLRSAGCRRATLWVLTTNAGARAFYEGRGWLADGAAREEVRGGAAQAELRYRKALDDTGSR